MGRGKQVASRRELAWNRWVGWAPGLVNHTLLHPACLPSLSVSRRQLYSSRRKCIPAYTSRPREAERYAGGGTLSVSQTASRSPKQPRASESRAEASRQHRQEASTLNINIIFLFICRSICYLAHYYYYTSIPSSSSTSTLDIYRILIETHT